MSDWNSENAGLAVSNAVADAIERAAGWTVMVDARKRLPSSGVIFQDGLVLTADHTVEREEGIRLVLPGGAEVQASLAGRDGAADLAVLRLEQSGGVSTAVQASSEARLGHLVVAVGRPAPEGVQASFGMVMGLGTDLATRRGARIERYLLTDAVPYPGFSGGPLVNLAGEVLGINSSGLVRGTSIAISADLAWTLASSLAQHGRIKRGFLGIRSQPVDLPQLGRSGLLLVGVEEGGPAASAGLLIGDVLLAVQGKQVEDHDSLLVALSGDIVGKAVDLTILRGGQQQNLNVVVGERA